MKKGRVQSEKGQMLISPLLQGLVSLFLPIVAAVGPGTWVFTPPATPLAHVAHHAPAPHHYGYTLAAPVAHHAVHHAAPVVHHAAHHAVAHHAVAHHAVVHAPVHHAYHAPKHNCSVVDVVESAEVCTPAFETVCETIEVPTKKIIDVEQCYPVTRTVCSESVEVIDNEICVYSYSQKVVATTAKTVTVPFKRECNTQMVTVCQPTPGYGYHQSHQCITVPELVYGVELEEKCITLLTYFTYQAIELT